MPVWGCMPEREMDGCDLEVSLESNLALKTFVLFRLKTVLLSESSQKTVNKVILHS